MIDFLHDDLTVNVRAKLILKGDGYEIESDEKVLRTLEFWPCGVEQSSFTDGDVMLDFGSNDRGYPVPDGSVFKAEPVDDAGKTEIAQILKEKFDFDVPKEPVCRNVPKKFTWR